MDCCNYVQPYPAHGHFYQQQQHNFCYDNTSAYGAGAYGIGGGVGGAPVSDAIEANSSRYNRLPPAYPTDYVYNPKEARLRKAMREQSRELSRQTILQTAIASATGNTSVGGPGCGSNGVGDNISPSPGAGTTNFLNHPLNCSASVAAATLSSLPGSPSFNAGNRIINPWFPGAHGPSTNHPKPILSPRVMTVAQHQQQQQQQHRTFDKTKEVLRQQAECAGAFTAASNPGYPADFSTHGNPGNLSGHQSSPHETNEYCVIAEFSDGQKWHPYQNGPSPYHSRPGGTLAKMGALHPGMQSTNQHAHTGWNQFCTVPLSTVGRTPRHMVFLQEQHQAQHCGFTDEMQMPYMQNKHMDIGRRLHPGYSQQEHQQSSKPQPSGMSPLNMSQLREPEKTIEDGPRWESSGGGSPGTSENSMVSMMRARRESDLKLHQDQDHEHGRVQQQDCRQHAKNREHQQRYSDEQSSSSSSSSSNGSETATKHHTKKPACTKQPLPGFHQAFGSTEIGRFSRSEFFANMVGGDGPVNLIPDGFLSASIFPFTSNSQVGICSGNSLGFPHLTTEEDILQQILPEDCIWIAQIPPHNGVSGLAEGKASYAFVDYSNRRDQQQDWLHATGSKGSKDRETGLVEQPSGAFFLRENNCTVSSAAREHRRDERPEYSEINSSGSTIAGSVNYVVRENRGRQESREKKTNDEEVTEPENLSSRSRHRDSEMRDESSTSK